MNVTIIVVSYNTCNILQQCLMYLEELTDAFNAQVIIVDNASSDGSAEMVETCFPLYTLIRNQKNLGFACANNQGIRFAKGEFILLLNSDAFLTAEALQVLIDYAVQHNKVGICGPQLINSDGTWQRSYGLIPSPRSAILDALGFTSLRHVVFKALWKLTGDYWRPKSVEYVDGACLLIRRAVIEQIGVLDERFFFFVEDADFCHRAWQRGWKVAYVPKSRVLHLRGQSSSKKNASHSQKLMRPSLQAFVTAHYGLHGWNTYCHWMRRNFWWRFRLCAFFSRFDLTSTENCEKYLNTYATYEQ